MSDAVNRTAGTSGSHRLLRPTCQSIRLRTSGLLNPVENRGAVRGKFRGKMAAHLWAIDEASKRGASPVLRDFTEVPWKCDVTWNNGKRFVSRCW